jgi:hypothetical protein
MAERPVLLSGGDWDKYISVKTVDFKSVKRQEERSRMRLRREAARSPEAAAAIQKQVSLVGAGAKWEITNFKEFARAASARWA